jgi:general L-amino acid transport system permease protein
MTLPVSRQTPPSTTPWSAKGGLGWLRQNLLTPWYNAVLTLLCLGVFFLVGREFLTWVLTQADWQVVQTNLRGFWVGRFPKAELWRVWTTAWLWVGLLACSWGGLAPWRNRGVLQWGAIALIGGVFCLMLGAGWLPSLGVMGLALTALGGIALMAGLRQKSWGKWVLRGLPLVWVCDLLLTLWLLGGGFGLSEVSRTQWNGLVLTLLSAIAGILFSFPLGLALALGRRSRLPVIRIVSTLYIEIVRGLPLIGILFTAQVMFPLVLPRTLEIDSVVRTIAGLALFSAAYLAENVRGGLQSIPQGQVEAAQALGLSQGLIVGLIVLPQALRAVIPAIVGQFIGLFKDTSLLSLVGLFELTGMARSILSQPEFIGRYAEVYGFVGLIYWGFCYGMSVTSRRVEAILQES